MSCTCSRREERKELERVRATLTSTTEAWRKRGFSAVSASAPLTEQLRVAAVNYSPFAIQGAEEQYSGSRVLLMSLDDAFLEERVYAQYPDFERVKDAEFRLRWSIRARFSKTRRDELVSVVDATKGFYESSKAVIEKEVKTLMDFRPHIILVDGHPRFFGIPAPGFGCSVDVLTDACQVIKFLRESPEMASVPMVYSSKYASDDPKKDRAIFELGAMASFRTLFFPEIEDLMGWAMAKQTS
jgi:hypothetical protein